LLQSGEHGSETWELHQGGATICDPFFVGRNVPGRQISQHICAQYGDNALSRKVVYEWIEMFKNGCMADAECSGCATMATTAQNGERARELILQNRKVTVNEIAKQLNINIGSAYSVVHDNLQFHKVCARWILKELTDEHKRMCLDSCSHHLACYREEGDNFLQWIVTGDETRVQSATY
jgi:hypothetical protein